ncbi:MAG TPA: MauE/DoxX family redox-associated membrane protein [Cyclobacteriaceae bacterium]|nr:MauE/DoxX family redox-associated membrane protein [Cyclobacteriaceae bacterium]
MNNRKELLIDVVSALFVVLFFYAAASKLLDYDKFKVQIGQSPLLTAFSGIVAWLVPAIEIIIATQLLVLRFRLWALYASFGLMVMFSAYIVVITRFSDYVPCSCGGVLEKMNWNEHLLFNLVFVVLAFVAILFYPKEEPKQST